MKLKVKNLYFGYKKSFKVLKDITFSLKQGEIFTLLGPNGSGKSTLLKCINKLLKPQKGVVFIGDKNINELNEKELAREVSYLPQEHNSSFPYTVLDIVLMGRAPYIGLLSSPSKKDVMMAKKAIETVGMTDLINKPYTELSGGQKKLVLIARALAQDAEILLLDEPTNHLDFKNQYVILSRIKKLIKNRGLSAIMTLHDSNLAMIFSDKVAMLKNGKIIAYGPVEEVMNERNLKELYEMEIEIFNIENRMIVLPKLNTLTER